jgi:hypothetical protein
MNIITTLLTTSLLALGLNTAVAQNVQQSGDVIVHYNVVPTTSLTPEVARQNGITRSASRALMNIAVQRQTDATLPVAITAKVDASAMALTGQRQSIVLREVREGDAIYYLGEVRVQDKEQLNFELEVLAEGASAPISVRFSQQFFVN